MHLASLSVGTLRAVLSLSVSAHHVWIEEESLPSLPALPFTGHSKAE